MFKRKTNMPQKNALPSRNRTLLLAATVITVTGVIIAAVAYSRNRPTSQPTYAPPQTQANLSPATDNEKQESNQLKEQSAPTASATPQTKKVVSPNIVDASQYGSSIEVRVNIPGLTENGGTCSITFTKGSVTFVRQVNSSSDASSTQCNNLVLDRSTFKESGTWSVTAAYSSATAGGTSDTATLEVK